MPINSNRQKWYQLEINAKPGRPSVPITVDDLKRYMAQKLTNKEIAAMLGVSLRTVERRISDYGLDRDRGGRREGAGRKTKDGGKIKVSDKYVDRWRPLMPWETMGDAKLYNECRQDYTIEIDSDGVYRYVPLEPGLPIYNPGCPPSKSLYRAIVNENKYITARSRFPAIYYFLRQLKSPNSGGDELLVAKITKHKS